MNDSQKLQRNYSQVTTIANQNDKSDASFLMNDAYSGNNKTCFKDCPDATEKYDYALLLLH